MSDIREMKEIVNSEDDEIIFAKDEVSNIFSDQYIAEATQNGTSHYEKMLGIIPKLTDSLDTRRFRILSRYNETLPYTLPKLKTALDTLCGKDGYSMEVFYSEFYIKVMVELTVKGMFEEVRKLLERMVPMNMVLDLGLLYNQHNTFRPLTHNKMAEINHLSLREEPIL